MAAAYPSVTLLLRGKDTGKSRLLEELFVDQTLEVRSVSDFPYPMSFQMRIYFMHTYAQPSWGDVKQVSSARIYG
jgi:hypothetical protein